MQKNKIYAVIGILVLLLISFIGGYVYAPSGTTYTISQGVYPGAPSYTIWRDGSTYYAKNDMGAIDYSGTNFTVLWDNVINGLPTVNVALPLSGYPTISAPYGSIYIKAGQYAFSPKLIIPLGSRIKIYGDGYTLQPSWAGQVGATQLRGSDANGLFNASSSGTLNNGTWIDGAMGTTLLISDIEFYQTVEQTDNTTVAFLLNGMSQGMLENVAITTYRDWGIERNGYGLGINTHGLSDSIQFINVQIFGFTYGAQLTADHLQIRGMGIGASWTALRLNPMNHLNIEELHLYATNVTIQVDAGPSDYPSMQNSILEIRNLYIESFGTTDATDVWRGNHSMKIIVSKAMVVAARSSAWNFQNASTWEFHNVIVNNTDVPAGFPTPVFPSATAPTIANNINIINPNPNQVWVSIYGGTVTSISINGYTTSLTTGRFLLRGEDYINVVYSSVPSWTWRNFDVDERSG